MASFSSNVLQWIIYDAYQQDYAAQQLEKELERERKERDKMAAAGGKQAQQEPKKAIGKAQLSEAVQARVLECWKVLERMINQNTYDDIAKGMLQIIVAIKSSPNGRFPKIWTSRALGS